MAYTIGEACIGCGLCAQKCPAACISGEKKQDHLIDPVRCFDCGVCASYCPVDCIADTLGAPTSRIRPKERPLAVVDGGRCSGCRSCVDVCPFDCIEMTADESHQTIFQVASVVRPKDCVACRLCATVCSDKEAIAVRWPDGRGCDSLTERSPVPAETG